MRIQHARRGVSQRPSLRSGWARMRAVALALVLAAVVALHLGLLAERIQTQAVFTPEVVLRWCAAFALVAALGVLRARGISLLRGRAALVIWTLVLLLHAAALVPALADLAETLGEAVRFGFLVVLPAACVLIILAFAQRLAPQTSAARPRRLFALEAELQPALAAGFSRVVACRPPPTL